MADAGRVIAGSARGIRLAAPGPGTRPLTDRVKQTLFAILDPDLDDASVLDLFAGSGAGGIEALSRGAAHAVLVEHDARACRVIAANLTRTGLADRAEVVRADALSWLSHAPGPGGPADAFDIVLVDPPYDQPEVLERALVLVDALVRPDGRVVAKHFWRRSPPAEAGLLASERERRFGETSLTFYRRRSSRRGERTQEAHER